MPDYDLLLDDEVRAFLAKSDAHYPPDAVNLSIAEQRAVYDAMCVAFDTGRPECLRVEDRAFGGVSCRVYTPEAPRGTVIYFHGGGFVVGGLESHDSICADLADGTGLRVVAVDYRLSPEHPFPNDFDDALAATRAVCAECAGPFVLAGDSAGGTLAASVAYATRGQLAFAGQMLVYPGLGGAGASLSTHSEAPALSAADIAFYRDIRAAGQDVLDDPRFAPLVASDFQGLPATVVVTAECDPLSSDGALYAQRLTAAGVQAVWREEAGLVHGYLRARYMSAKARDSFARIVEDIRAMSLGRCPDA